MEQEELEVHSEALIPIGRQDEISRWGSYGGAHDILRATSKELYL